DKVVAARISINKKLWGFFDRSGRTVLEPQFDSGSFLGENRAVVRKGNKYGLVDAAGKLVVPPQYDDGGWIFSEGLIPVAKGGKFGFIDGDGKVVIEPQYDAVGGFTPGNLCAIRIGKKWVFIDRNNKRVIPPQYDMAVCFSQDRAAIRIGDVWGFIDTAGKIVAEPKFHETGYFSCGLAPVRVDRKWGYVDKTGALAIPLQFDNAQNFENGLAQVTMGNRTAYINTMGKTVWMTQVDKLVEQYAKASEQIPGGRKVGTAPGGSAVRTLKVRVTADRSIRERPDWRTDIEQRMQSVSAALESNVNIRLVVTDIVPWEPPEFEKEEDSEDHYYRLRYSFWRDNPLRDDDIIIAFIGQDPRTQVLGTSSPYSSHLNVMDKPGLYNRDDEKMMRMFRDVIVHEICHLFGAFHVKEKTSIMYWWGYPGKEYSFDQYTVRQMNLMHDYDFTKGVDALDEATAKKAMALWAEGRDPNPAANTDVNPLAKSYGNRGLELEAGFKGEYPDETALADAIQAYYRAIAFSGAASLRYFGSLGRALLEDGQYAAGFEALRKYLAQAPDKDKAKWHVALADNLKEQEERDTEFMECQRPVSAMHFIECRSPIVPTLAEIYQRYVVTRANPDEVIAEFRQAITLEPKNALYHAKLAEALFARGSIKEALAECQQADTLKLDNIYYKSVVEGIKIKARIKE
ncbi:MAG: WG repeat-containing protein, partial [Desulfobacterales bacterium]|nr:WG repeat-containing protein [Desulfobacterales bacterium]